MKKSLPAILISLLALVACDTTDKPEPAILEDKTLSELYEILASDLLQPEDSLVQVRYYSGAGGEADRLQDYYYDQAGKPVLSVSKTPEADTVGLSIFKYDESGNRTQRIYFTKEDGYTLWNSTVEQVYNADNLEIEIFISRAQRSKSLHAQKFYNPSRQLIETRFASEAFVYDYNGKGLIATEKWILLDAPSQPLNTYYYRHDSLGRLVAKEIHVNSDIPERKDAFQYDYHKGGQLKEEREFETRFGFSLKERKEFVYQIPND